MDNRETDYDILPNVFSHYQCPLLSHLSLPLFTRNLERGPGDTRLAPAQLSLRSLWPVTLANPTSPGTPPSSPFTISQDHL